MGKLREIIGTEQDFDQVSRALRQQVERERPPVVGALLVTCSDESERECIDAFQHGFVDALLPDFKLWSKSAFRSANLGARYEWGAVRVAEQHFATHSARTQFKTVVVKINAHVAVERTPDGDRFGRMQRYETESPACGAIHALLEDLRQPFTKDLHDALIVDARDIVETLKDPERVAPVHQRLFAAIVSARVQARRATLDIQDYRPTTPTLYIVLPCVTLNRAERDTEIPVGVYTADYRADPPRVEYRGLGDDPSKYVFEYQYDQIVVRDDQIDQPRAARDHRKHLIRQWHEKHAAKANLEALHRDERFAKFLDDARQNKHKDHHVAKAMVKNALVLLADLNPISAALALFGGGVADIYHAHRIHKIIQDASRDDSARRVLTDVQDRIESLPPEMTQKVIDVLMSYYKR